MLLKSDVRCKIGKVRVRAVVYGLSLPRYLNRYLQVKSALFASWRKLD